MSFFRFTKVPKHKTYHYNTRYYDAKKEDLQGRLSDSKNAGTTTGMKSRISQGLRSNRNQKKAYAKSGARKSNIRLLITIIVVFIVTYLILKFNADDIINFVK